MRYILLGGLLSVFTLSMSQAFAQETCAQLSCDCKSLVHSSAVSSCQSREVVIKAQCAKSSGSKFGYCNLSGAAANRVALTIEGLDVITISDFDKQLESARWSLDDFVRTSALVHSDNTLSRALSTELSDSLGAHYDIEITRYQQLKTDDADDAASYIKRSIARASDRVDELSEQLSMAKADTESSQAHISLLMQAEGEAIEYLARLQLLNEEYRASAVNYRVAAQSAHDTYVYTLTHDQSWAKRYVRLMMGRFNASASAYYLANEVDRAKVMLAEQQDRRQEAVRLFSVNQ